MSDIDPILKILQEDARLSPSEIAERLGMDTSAVEEKIKQYNEDGTILGYHAIISESLAGSNIVQAIIEVKLLPERDGGFDRIAQRIAKFDQVDSCFLMSGGYDLLVVVRGTDLREVASFVSEKLSSLEGVRSTATRFQLKKYKQSGFLANSSDDVERLPVSP